MIIDQWNRTENPQINPPIHGQLTNNNKSSIHSGQKPVSSVRGFGKIGQLRAEEPNWTTILHHLKKKKTQRLLKT